MLCPSIPISSLPSLKHSSTPHSLSQQCFLISHKPDRFNFYASSHFHHGTVGQGAPRSLLDVPFNERWELLKPTIERLYIDEKRKLPDVMKILKDQYGFDAV